MPFLLNRAIRFFLHRIKSLLRASRAGRSLLYDLNNQIEFNSLLSHERMLADRVRVDAYYKAIRRNVKAGQTVIDLGTGTGILALFAATQSPARIHALDHSSFINLAQKIANHNGIECIEFVNQNSRDFIPEERVDLLIHEQMGDELLTENMLDNLLDLKNRCLKPGGRILPARFELFLEPIQLHGNQAIPHIWERQVHGIDFGILRNDPEADRFKPPDYNCLLLEPASADYLLCSPTPIMEFDLNQMDSPEELECLTKTCKQVIRAGRMDGLALYFRVIFDDDLAFDTSPLSPYTHWRYRLFRTPAREVAIGETMEVMLELPDFNDVHSWKMTLNGTDRSALTEEVPEKVVLETLSHGQSIMSSTTICTPTSSTGDQ